jgi:hypothetical protein
MADAPPLPEAQETMKAAIERLTVAVAALKAKIDAQAAAAQGGDTAALKAAADQVNTLTDQLNASTAP